jgi:hypothetical protein
VTQTLTHKSSDVSTPFSALTRLRGRLEVAALSGFGVLGLAAAVDRLVAPLPASMIAWGRPIAATAFGVAAVAESLRFARWAATHSPVFRWTRAAAGLTGAAVVLARVAGETTFGSVVLVLLSGGTALVGAAVIVDVATGRKHRRLARRDALGASAGAVGLLTLSALIAAESALALPVWRGLFLVALPLLAAGALAFAHRQHAPAAGDVPDRVA